MNISLDCLHSLFYASLNAKGDISLKPNISAGSHEQGAVLFMPSMQHGLGRYGTVAYS